MGRRERLAVAQLLRGLGRLGHVHGVSNLGPLLTFQRAAPMEGAAGSEGKREPVEGGAEEVGTDVCGGGSRCS